MHVLGSAVAAVGAQGDAADARDKRAAPGTRAIHRPTAEGGDAVRVLRQRLRNLLTHDVHDTT